MMGFKELVSQPLGADKSAVGMMNRPLRLRRGEFIQPLLCYFVKLHYRPYALALNTLRSAKLASPLLSGLSVPATQPI